MKKQWIVFVSGLGLVLSLSSCNMFEFMDSPSGNPQLIEAARACFDAGDWACAREYYGQLTGDEDNKISKLALLTLAENNIFKLTDLIDSLGSGTGNGSSLALLAGVMHKRGKFDAATRVTIQEVYESAAAITNDELRGFTQFVAANAMVNSILAIDVGADEILAATDLVNTPGTCATTCCAITCAADCGTSGDLADGTGVPLSMSSASGWSTHPPTHDQLLGAADATSTAANLMTGSSSGGGIVSTLNTLQAQLGVAADENCRRAVIKEVLFSN